MTWPNFFFAAAFAVGVALITYFIENRDHANHSEVPVSARNSWRQSEISDSDDEREYPYMRISANANRLNSLSSAVQSPTSRSIPPRSSNIQFPTGSSSASDGKASSRKNRIDSDCTICLEEIEPHETSTLDCRHAFHIKCLEEIKSRSSIYADGCLYRCPVCRAEYFS